ncbi:type III pantothenate kinase [Lentisphaerota bacterium WC36G]|nr:type III pantothenate kinase [Lentisphaerae bacterium WC36]
MKIFLINIGNTHIQYTICKNGIIDNFKQIPTEDFTLDIIPKNIQIAAASVVPKIKEQLQESSFSNKIFWLTHDKILNIDLSRVNAKDLGADRLANAIILAEHTNKNTIAVSIDFGTCITFEIVDNNQIFRGGAIVPGRKLLRKALHNYTAQLPLIPLHDTTAPDLGESTESAMRLGIDNGVIGTVKELINDLETRFHGCAIQIFATGGDQKFFTERIEKLIEGNTFFTLRGILKAWEMNNNNEG